MQLRHNAPYRFYRLFLIFLMFYFFDSKEMYKLKFRDIHLFEKRNKDFDIHKSETNTHPVDGKSFNQNMLFLLQLSKNRFFGPRRFGDSSSYR